MNQVMSETGAKKIGFLKSVNAHNIDQKKLEMVDSLKVKANEFDERLLQKTTFMQDGRMHVDVIPTVYQH